MGVGPVRPEEPARPGFQSEGFFAVAWAKYLEVFLAPEERRPLEEGGQISAVLDVELAKGDGDEVLKVGAGLFEAERRARAHVDEDASLPIDPDQIARACLGVLEVVCAGPQHLDVDPAGTAGPAIDDHLEGAFRNRPSQPGIVNVHAPALGVGQGATH